MKKVVGIIGGMGPLATVDLMNKIIQRTPANKDQDHIHVIADNYTQIPDRTTAILGKGANPAPYIEQSARRLEEAGADFLVIACNTAHFFYKSADHAVSIPILHMPQETAVFLKKNHINKVGLLATSGTLNTNLYQRSCESYSIEVLEPDSAMQETVMQGIYAIKGGDLEKGHQNLLAAAKELLQEGAEAIIAGCTEIPLVLSSSSNMHIIDPTEILADMVIETSLGLEERVQA
ncbi:amino acid racemase [Domibacillus indicus]|uniref:aspartate/glutamate racemase family protein n=1 Tax=Domibacillus indicus TaxID=1437523 RepID=UPI00203E78E7|nr:amino acid racemase [Domibacillus indicus]MCM3791437.1 amino acid racemase [Domibacillus indicus]